MVEQSKLSADYTSRDLVPVASAVHVVFSGLPVTIRIRNNLGVKIEEGEVKSLSYIGPILERVTAENNVIKTRPDVGDYVNVPVIVAPIRDSSGSAIPDIGFVDITGIFDLADLMTSNRRLLARCVIAPGPLKTRSR